jgi:uncharacterized membrane protein (UPF0182 family)
VLLAVLALVKAAGYYLQQFTLSVSTRGTVDGPTYTDVHTQLPAIKLLLVISLFSVALFLYNIFRRGWVLPVLGVGLWAFVAVVAGTIVPALVQKFRVEPSESSKERPYIERNIAATRAAMNIDTVTQTPFKNDNVLNTQTLLANQDQMNNIRLWDPAPNLTGQTYQQLQALKPFYKLNDVDVDRYSINGAPTQVDVSARELDTANVPQQSWEGTHLTFTHGYGVVLSSASKQAPNGQPDLLVRDIPLRNDAGIPLTEPRLYFGNHLDGYVVVNTKRQEIDYQDTSGQNVLTEYTGKDGISVSSWLRRAAFALRFYDFNPLVSGDVTGSSRILINRDIYSRVRSIAPFLSWDGDAYPALVDGRIQWIVDGYTTTDRYPYAQRAITDGTGGLGGTFNYVRNSVKAVIDAYDGTITLYVVDHEDPIIRAYQKAFPKLFSSADPGDALRAHFRYPEDLFRVQTNMWGRYHLSNPDEFYTQGNAWTVAPDPGTVTQTSASSVASGQDTQTTQQAANRIAPYYQLLHLQDDNALNFVILRPFVPLKGNNQQMTAFMVARSDPQNYGKLTTYEMPGNGPPPAPTLVASNMSSDPAVGELQTLLGIRGGGSDLLFGNLITVPIQQSLLYVRPVYVKAAGDNNPPLLRKVVVQFNNAVKVADTLPDALKLFPQFADLPTGTTPPPSPSTGPAPAVTAQELLAQALQDYQDANNALKQGDLATFKLKIDDAQRKTEQAQQILSGGAPADTTTTTTSTTSTTLSGASA